MLSMDKESYKIIKFILFSLLIIISFAFIFSLFINHFNFIVISSLVSLNLVMIALALKTIKHTTLEETPKILWIFFILILPLIGSAIYYYISPGESVKDQTYL